MPGIRDQIQDALDEARTLVLGTQVLLGLQYQSVFEPRFPELRPEEQLLSLAALLLLLVAFCLLILPAAAHLIAWRGEDRGTLYAFTTQCVAWALTPFALALGVALYLATSRIAPRPAAMTTGFAATVLAVSFWFGLGFERPRRKARLEDGMAEESAGKTPLHDKIRHVLTEARVVIPGAQALLGFSCITTLMESFDGLPAVAKILHLVSLAAVALSVVLLMTPAAYHRLGGHGEETERFFRLASSLVVAAMLPLAIALAGELFVVFLKVTGSLPLSTGISVVALLVFITMWYVVPLVGRRA